MKTKSTAWALFISAGVYLFSFFPTPQAYAQSITLIYEKEPYSGIIGDAQVEILAASGARVLIDIAKPSSLSRPVTSQDILLTTHLHSDHYNWAFAQSFPGKQIRMEHGEITTPDLAIKSIASSHSSLPPAEPGDADNYIYVVDIRNLRIVHFGDLEQSTLTQEQIEELGKVDVAVIGLWVDPSNKHLNIMDQVSPRLIIPTHLEDTDALQYAIQKWPSYQRQEKWLSITPDCLPVQTTFILLGYWANEYAKTFKMQEWECK